LENYSLVPKLWKKFQNGPRSLFQDSEQNTI
jgi:hypothetical protein